jgi:DNA-binding response OmpR family regulator
MNKVLIVEDDQLLLEIYQKKFKDDGFEVEVADNGVDAIKKIQKFVPDITLLDLVMPEEDGFGVLEKIKKLPEGKDTNIIVFSNLSQDEDKERAKALGAAGFITKADFTPQEVVDRVRDILKLYSNKKAEE